MSVQKDKPFDHTGSSFDSFLEEEEILDEVNAVASRRVSDWQAAEETGSLQARTEEMQRTVCEQYGTDFAPAMGSTKTGFALSTKGLTPVNGVRHPIAGDTSGWYIWCGDIFSDAPDFFAPLHTDHLYEDHPEIARLLGLPPGYRFLLAGDYLDVWYDASLLNVRAVSGG